MTQTIIFQEEPFDIMYEESIPLQEMNWLETSPEGHRFELDVDAKTLSKMAKEGNIVTITARGEFGRMVGYAMYTLQRNLIHKSHIWATNVTFWLHPDYRKGGNALRMLDFCDKILTGKGVSAILAESLFLDSKMASVLQRKHYEPITTLYIKVI